MLEGSTEAAAGPEFGLGLFWSGVKDTRVNRLEFAEEGPGGKTVSDYIDLHAYTCVYTHIHTCTHVHFKINTT